MKTLSTALIMGFFGALAVFVSVSLQFPTWILFIAWVSYYLFGKSLKTSVISLIPIAFGVFMGVAIQFIAKGLSEIVGQLGFPLVVFVFIGSLAYLSKVEIFSNIPAWFIGLIIFFGAHPPMESLPILILFIPVIAGVLFAFLNDSAVSMAVKKITKK
ncbi:MAG: DUF1097 domain-containing protein [Paludibacter sp.]|nr:DUF1097 domain-containing protein [Paludibacter sp.]